MSENVNRSQVFETTRVRSALKNDGSWIQKVKQGMEARYIERTEPVVETRPSPVRQNSYVMSTAKKFEPQAPMEEPTKTGEAQPEEAVVITTTEVNDDKTDPAVDQSSGELKDPVVETSVDVQVEEHIQNGDAHPEETVVDATADIKEVNDDAAVTGTVVQAHKEQGDLVPETCADVQREEHIKNGDAHPEETVVDATADTKVVNDDATVTVTVVHLSKEQGDLVPETCVDVQVEEHIQNQETQPVSHVEPAEQPDAGMAAENQSDAEDNKATVSADAHVEDAVVETSAVAITVESQDTAKVPAVNGEETKPQVEDSMQTLENATHVEDAGKESTVQAAEDIKVECPPEKAAEEIVETVSEIVLDPSADKNGVINATPGEEAALPDSVEAVAESLAGAVSDSPTQPAAEASPKSVECQDVCAASEEPALKKTSEEVVESVVQPVEDTIVEQSVEPKPEGEADGVVELKAEDAVEPPTAPDTEAAQDATTHEVIKLTDALDVEPPTAEAAPEPVEDPKQSHTEENKQSVQSDQTNTPPVCSFCDKIIDGTVKISLSEPVICCHPECLKCGVCAKALGDLLSPMFLHNQVIQCDVCFEKALMS